MSMPQVKTPSTNTAIADRRTQRLLHIPAMRIFTPLLNSDNPVLPQPHRELLPEAFHERGSVLIQERHKRYRPFLCVTVGECERPRPDELTSQRFVTPLGSLNGLALQRFQVLLHA